MKTCKLTYLSSCIHYYQFGTGKNLLFCFHGYGENGRSFEVLERLIGKDFTLIALDAPHHGDTEWNEGSFTPQQLSEIILIIAGNENKFSIAGFSMGGRMVLQLLQSIPSKIENAVLLAPDGLHKNFWYRFTTQTNIGNKLFSYSMKHPVVLFELMEWSSKLRLLNKAFYKVAHYYLEDEASRLALYRRWSCMRKLTPRLQKIKKIISTERIPVRFVFGAYDKVILSKTAQKFISGIEQFASVNVIEAGHQLLKDKHAPAISKFFYP